MKKITLRPYQQEILDKIDAYLKNDDIVMKRGLVISPVGSGKSICISSTAHMLKGKTVVIQPTVELLNQNLEKLRAIGGDAKVYSAGAKSKELGDITYATIGSIYKKAKEFKKHGVVNVIVDECNQYPPTKGSMFRQFIDIVNPKIIIGFTATPCRLYSGLGEMNDSYSVINFITNKILRDRKNLQLMDNGAILIDPATTYIEENVEIGEDTVIYPNVIIQGDTKIGKNCVILSNTRIENSVIKDNVRIESSLIEKSTLEEGVTVGPFAHLRPKAHLKENVHVGNFVEIKNAVLEKGVKAGHLTYLGDAEVGENTNIGAGTITCNYDGKNKHKTKIGKESFIGSNSIMVAPVEIGEESFTAAGSVITENVPDSTLAFGRARQINKEGWKK